ncbi:hypothetical protein Bca4012_031717 [Brassica carinata]
MSIPVMQLGSYETTTGYLCSIFEEQTLVLSHLYMLISKAYIGPLCATFTRQELSLNSLMRRSEMPFTLHHIVKSTMYSLMPYTVFSQKLMHGASDLLSPSENTAATEIAISVTRDNII